MGSNCFWGILRRLCDRRISSLVGLCVMSFAFACARNSTAVRLANSLAQAQEYMSEANLNGIVCRAMHGTLGDLKPGQLREPVPVVALRYYGSKRVWLLVAWAGDSPTIVAVVVRHGEGEEQIELSFPIDPEDMSENTIGARTYVSYRASWAWPAGHCPLPAPESGACTVLLVAANGKLACPLPLREVDEAGCLH